MSTLTAFIDSGRAISPRRQDAGIPAYEVGHIQSGVLLPTNVFVSPKTDKILEKGDLLTGRVGGLGQFAVYDGEEPASFSDNTLRLRLDQSQCGRAAYISAFLNSNLGRSQLLRDSRGGLQKVVTQESVGRIMVPSVGPKEASILAELERARGERDQALAESDRLLNSIDELVIEVLGLPAVHAGTQYGYAIRLGLAKTGSTLSADYFHPERMRALRAIQAIPNAALASLVSFERHIVATPGASRYIGLASVASNTGQLTDAVESATGQCFRFATDDVLYGRLRPYLNKVWLSTIEGVCSTEFHVIRVLDRSALLPAYLAVVMRTQLIVAQTKHMMTGNTHPRLAIEDVGNLLIPLADIAEQQRIVNEVEASQRKAASLRSYAESVWRQASERFEQQILQGNAP